MKLESNENAITTFIHILLLALVIIYPIAHTIAIRYFIYAFLFFYAIFSIKNFDKKFIFYITVFYIWIVIQSLLLSQVPKVSLGDLSGAWLRFGLALVAGVVASKLNFFKSRILVYYLYITSALIIINYLLIIFNLPDYYLYSRKHGVAFIFGLIVIIFNDSSIRRNIIFYCVLVLTNSRAMLISIIGSLLISANKIKKIALIVPVLFTLATNSAWHGIFHDVIAGITLSGNAWHGDIKESGVNWPKDEGGLSISHASNYERPAWIISGLHYTLVYPLGYGSLHDSYKRIITNNITDSDPRYASSHSGVVDIILAIGYPGALLLVLLLYIFISRSNINNSKSVLLFLLIASILDATTRDELLEMIALLIGYGYLHKDDNNLHTNL